MHRLLLLLSAYLLLSKKHDCGSSVYLDNRSSLTPITMATDQGEMCVVFIIK